MWRIDSWHSYLSQLISRNDIICHIWILSIILRKSQHNIEIKKGHDFVHPYLKMFEKCDKLTLLFITTDFTKWRWSIIICQVWILLIILLKNPNKILKSKNETILYIHICKCMKSWTRTCSYLSQLISRNDRYLSQVLIIDWRYFWGI